jgi:hypothetical protein
MLQEEAQAQAYEQAAEQQEEQQYEQLEQVEQPQQVPGLYGKLPELLAASSQVGYATAQLARMRKEQEACLHSMAGRLAHCLT